MSKSLGTHSHAHATGWGVRRLAVLAAASLGLGLLAPALAPSAASADDPQSAVVTVDHLTTNGRTSPLGIPGDDPTLGWVEHSAGRGVVQSAYQVRVASSEARLEAPDVWDSGQVVSDRQVDVPYDGPALASQTRYYWQVRTWDGDGTASAWSEPSYFETGLLQPSDWQADWITRDDDDSAKWSDYTTTVDFHLDNLAFGVFFRGATTNDTYMWQLTVADGTPRLKIHERTGGSYAVLENKDISGSISAGDLTSGDHTLAITADGSTITTSLDGAQIDSRTDDSFDHGYVGLRTSTATEGNEAVTVHDVDVTTTGGETLLDADFENGKNPFSAGTVSDGDLKLAGNMDAWYVPSHPLPLLRDEFSTEAGKTIADARLFASARGVYQLSLNGQQVGDQHLAPGSTNFTKRIQAQTYDVTDLVSEGANAVGAELGAGWYAGRNFWLQPGYFGSDTSLIAQLRIDYTDGTSQLVTSDGSWTTHDGPFVQADNIDGETYDARLEQPGFDTVGFDDTGWRPAAVAQDTTDKLVPQPDEPVRTSQVLTAKSRTENPSGSFLYDLGQNMVGVSRVTLTGHAGDTVRIRYGEVLNPDGTLYTANLRSAKATDYYTFAADGTVTYEPTFTFHGFRYVEITGASTPPATEDVTGQVWGSDLPATGTLQTSDPMLNQLVSNISWGQRGNFLSIPTDTPARDERLGWLGDINVFSPTASYLRDTRGFMRKWLADLRDSQQPSGAFPGVAPDYGSACCGGGTAWEDAMITVPYAVFRAYGDTALVRENYAAMQKFLEHVRTSAGADLIDSDRNVYGDWLNLGDDTPAGVIGTAYYAEDSRMLAEMADAIGEDADASEYADLSSRVRAAFTDAFVQPDGTVSTGSQTAYALALGMDLVPQEDREKIGQKFVAKVHASDDHLTTGFVGTPLLLPALSGIGETDLAYKLLENKTFPSWGYEIEQGATTMWERWDSIKPDGSFGDVGMNSFNHYAYGAVGDWMYRNIGGIAPLDPGYKSVRVAPVMGGGLTHAAGSFDSAYGTIATDWTRDGDDLSLAVDVPVNTTAQVVLPADNEYAVTEGGSLLGDVVGVQDVADGDGDVTVTVGSGHYEFAVTAADSLLGSILEDLAALQQHVGDLADAGDLADDDRAHLDEALSSASDDVRAAVTADPADDAGARTDALRSALQTVQDLRAWLETSGIDAPVRGDLDRRLGSVEQQLVAALSAALGVVVGLPPVADPVLPGSDVTATLEVTNNGTEPLTGLSGLVSVDGWDGSTFSADTLGVGESTQIPVRLSVPKHAHPGGYDATYALSFTVGQDQLTLTGATPDWVRVTSGLTVGEVTATMGQADPPEHAVLTVPVTNAGASDVRAHVVATVPDGWRSVPSPDVDLPAGQTTSVEVPVVVPLDVVGGATPVTVDVVQAGTTLVSKDATPSFDLVTPPTADTLDHVDFGDADSETAHALQAAAPSGTNTEAGYTRRYANSASPGSWYSVQVDVPVDAPFVLRDIETFDGARTKKYNVYVDDQLVKTQLVPRSEGGAGIKVYDALVDDPAAFSDDGTARIKFEFPSDASGFFDPSIADLWVLGVPEDTQAPDVSAAVLEGTVGDHGWYRSPVTVKVSAADNRDGAPMVQTGESSGWQDYSTPVAIAGEGKHALSYRASDAAGNASGTRTLPVWIDTTAPSTTMRVARGAGVAGSDRATLTFQARDALSGVAATTYRIDGGDWQTLGAAAVHVRGYGDHTVDVASTDVAGNPEPMQHLVVTLSDVDRIAAVVPPAVHGKAKVGKVLSSTLGSWNTTGLSFSRQWLRNGHAVKGATGKRYHLRKADAGKRMSVRVVARKHGLPAGRATSARTAKVAGGHR